MQTWLKTLLRVPAKFLITLLVGFRRYSVLGPAACKYPISCTDYAVEQLNEEALPKALWRITKRILSCW